MVFINKFKDLGGKSLIFKKYSLYLNEVRKNPAAPGKQLLPSPKSAYFWCSTTYIHVGDLDQSPLIRSYGYASAGDQSTLFAKFPLTFNPFMQYGG